MGRLPLNSSVTKEELKVRFPEGYNDGRLKDLRDHYGQSRDWVINEAVDQLWKRRDAPEPAALIALGAFGVVDVIPDFDRHNFTSLLNSDDAVTIITDDLRPFLFDERHRVALVDRFRHRARTTIIIPSLSPPTHRAEPSPDNVAAVEVFAKTVPPKSLAAYFAQNYDHPLLPTGERQFLIRTNPYFGRDFLFRAVFTADTMSICQAAEGARPYMGMVYREPTVKRPTVEPTTFESDGEKKFGSAEWASHNLYSSWWEYIKRFLATCHPHNYFDEFRPA